MMNFKKKNNILIVLLLYILLRTKVDVRQRLRIKNSNVIELKTIKQ